MQSKYYCFTLNNYTDEDVAHLRQIANSDHVVYLIFGREVGDSGTRHLQGFVTFDRRKRLQQVRSLISDVAHFERALGTPHQASEYCKKDGDFELFGVEPPNVPTRTGAQGHWADFAEWVNTFYRETQRAPTARDAAIQFPALIGRNRAGCLSLIEDLLPRPHLQDGELREWQIGLNNDLHSEPNDRTIRFIVDQDGGKGKTFFVRWFYTNNQDITQILSIGKIADVAYMIDVTKKVFLFNVPRGGMKYLQYSILEAMKDRLVFSPKFTSVMKVMLHNPHVVVLCNESPDEEMLTSDRYDIQII